MSYARAPAQTVSAAAGPSTGSTQLPDSVTPAVASDSNADDQLQQTPVPAIDNALTAQAVIEVPDDSLPVQAALPDSGDEPPPPPPPRAHDGTLAEQAVVELHEDGGPANAAHSDRADEDRPAACHGIHAARFWRQPFASHYPWQLHACPSPPAWHATTDGRFISMRCTGVCMPESDSCKECSLLVPSVTTQLNALRTLAETDAAAYGNTPHSKLTHAQMVLRSNHHSLGR
jgi:hypothetical protein